MRDVRTSVGNAGTPDDQTLIAQIADGNSQAMSMLYDRYSRIVYGLALRMLGNAELAEDVVQETFWRVWRRSATFQVARGQVSSWVFGIAHNLAVDELRRQRVRPTPIYDTEDHPVLRDLEDTGVDALGSAIDKERRQLVATALQSLPPEQREVLELAYFGGFSQSEIAEKLKSPIGTVKTRVRLALTKLREHLSGQGFQIEDLAG